MQRNFMVHIKKQQKQYNGRRIKKLLESAKTQGASDDNLRKLIDLYEADFSQKNLQ